MLIIKYRTQLVGWGGSHEENSLVLNLTNDYSRLDNVFLEISNKWGEGVNCVCNWFTSLNFSCYQEEKITRA